MTKKNKPKKTAAKKAKKPTLTQRVAGLEAMVRALVAKVGVAGPQGDKGAKGDTGATGAKGEKGGGFFG